LARSLVVTCEHGGNRVPREYAPLFRGKRRLLRSHRGWDIGALALARRFPGPLRFSTVTRLLVDLNRSQPRGLFAPFIPRSDRERILARYWLPYRLEVIGEVAAHEETLHLSVHTFTPRLRGEVRPMDVGLLFDPSRPGEAEFCARWQALLRREGLTVHRNAPYKGTSDGFTTWFRRRTSPQEYWGIELEVNQKHAGGPIGRPLVRTFREVFR
jgi:predicted N-formylglutamate amidohydrolase